MSDKVEREVSSDALGCVSIKVENKKAGHIGNLIRREAMQSGSERATFWITVLIPRCQYDVHIIIDIEIHGKCHRAYQNPSSQAPLEDAGEGQGPRALLVEAVLVKR